LGVLPILVVTLHPRFVLQYLPAVECNSVRQDSLYLSFQRYQVKYGYVMPVGQCKSAHANSHRCVVMVEPISGQGAWLPG